MQKLKSFEQLYAIAKNYDLITFDLFNTLINRKVFKPEDAIKVLDYKVSKKFSTPLNTFYNLRLKAAKNAALMHKDVEITIDEIYLEIFNLSKIFSLNQLEIIKKMEIDNDVDLSIPRTKVVELLNKLKKDGKKICIITDTYYPSNVINKFITKNSIPNVDKVIVSSTTGYMKSNGTIWTQFFNEHFNQTTLHIGDQFKGDYLQVSKLNKKAVLIPSSFSNGKKTKFFYSNRTLEEKVINGLVFNKCIFNSPFASANNIVATPYNYGYAVLGPLFFDFFIWLIRISNKTKKLFLSRDGYFLKKIFDKFCAAYHLTNQESKYIYTSRKVARVAQLKTFNDISQYIKLYGYRGTMKDFFESRFGIVIDKKFDRQIDHSLSYKYTLGVAKIYEKKILDNAKKLYLNYKKYLLGCIDNDSILIDLGYHCSIQYAISKILEKNVITAYYLTHKPQIINNKEIKFYSCYNQLFKWFKLTRLNILLKNLHVNSCIEAIETVFTAPHGQLINISDDLKPVFDKNTASPSRLKLIDTTIEGILDFINDFSNTCPAKLEDIKLNTKQIYLNFWRFYKLAKKGKISNELYDLFVEENVMCGWKVKHMFPKAKGKN